MKNLKWIGLAVIMMVSISCEDVIIRNISDDSVELLLPANNAEENVNPVHFSWRELPGATSYQFQLISEDFGLTNQYIVDSSLSKNWIEIHLTTPGKYQWRVQGVNSEFRSKFTIRTIYLQQK